MYHDTVSLAVSLRFFLRSVFLRLHARFSVSLVCVGDPDANVFHEVLSQDAQSKVFNVETSQLEGIPCHEWYNVLLGSTQLSLLVSTRLGTWFFPLLPTKLETWNSRVVYPDLSRGMKVNEFADLTTSDFVSEYSEDKPNIVWGGRKHLETHEYVDEPLDQVEPDSCFQSSDEGPSLLFFVSLNCR